VPNQRSRAVMMADAVLVPAHIGPHVPPQDLVDALDLIAELYRRIAVAIGSEHAETALPDVSSACNLGAVLRGGVEVLAPLLDALAARLQQLAAEAPGDGGQFAAAAGASLRQRATPRAVDLANTVTAALQPLDMRLPNAEGGSR
jgi:hypothetical protein